MLFRSLIKRSPLFYRLIAGKNIGNVAFLADRETNLVVEGFPRSGNTHAFHLIQSCFPNIVIGHHTHSVAALNACMRFNLPLLVVVRVPLDSLASALVYRGQITGDPMHEAFCYLYRDYVDFFTTLNKVIRTSQCDVLVVSFETLTKSPESVIGEVLGRWGGRYKTVEDRTISEICLNALAAHRLETDKQSADCATLPSAERAKKQAVAKHFLENEKSYELETLTNIYDRLCRQIRVI